MPCSVSASKLYILTLCRGEIGEAGGIFLPTKCLALRVLRVMPHRKNDKGGEAYVLQKRRFPQTLLLSANEEVRDPLSNVLGIAF